MQVPALHMVHDASPRPAHGAWWTTYMEPELEP